MENRPRQRISDAVIDLTSLLDVVFIILFLVMQRTGGMALSAVDRAEELEAALEQREAEALVLNDALVSVQSRLDSIELLNDTAVVASIHVLPAGEDGKTNVEITWGKDGGETIPLTRETLQTGERRLQSRLTGLSESHADAPVFIVFQYNDNLIHRMDFEMIRGVLETLKSDHTNIYLEFVQVE